MKNIKRILTLTIAILMIVTLFLIPTFADASSTLVWENGAMPTVEELLKSTSGDYASDNGIWKTHYYEDSDVFSYVAFVKGTNAVTENETRAVGYYPMGIATAEHPNLNGQAHWFRKGYYTPAYELNGSEMIQDKAKNTWSNGVAFCAGAHYCPGVAFTAPADGVVQFEFSYILNLASPNNTWSNRLLIGKSDMTVNGEKGTSYSNFWKKYTGDDKSDIESGNSTFTVEVTAGEQIYFIIDGSGAGESRFWIDKVSYVDANDVTLDVKGTEVAPTTPDPDTGNDGGTTTPDIPNSGNTDSGNADNTDNGNTTTDESKTTTAPSNDSNTTEPSVQTTDAPESNQVDADKEKDGCGSSVSMMMLPTILLIGGAFVGKKKRK